MKPIKLKQVKGDDLTGYLFIKSQLVKTSPTAAATST